ncbi:TIGR01777 family oxidoreductase [soil metagenome]
MAESVKVYRSHLPVSASVALAWHGRQGAFERLTPPWADVQVLAASGTIAPGDTKTLRIGIGPFYRNWSLEHAGNPNHLGFVDRQLSGPFKRWTHEHSFIDDPDGGSWLVDTISYSLPLAFLGRRLLRRPIERQLDTLFSFRHRRTISDLTRIQRFGGRDPLRIAITGSAGLVGDQLVSFLKAAGQHVIPIVRRSTGDRDEVLWNPELGSIDAEKLEGIDAAIHLAGESIAKGRWTTAKKKRILESRRQGTELIANTLSSLQRPPKVLVSASAVGYYGNRNKERLTESSPAGEGFLADVCKIWEDAAHPAVAAGIRVVHPRFGVVLSGKGGMLKQLAPLFRVGLGGKIGNGEQYMSWIDIDDLIGILGESVINERLSGPINAVAPVPVTNKAFTKLMGNVLRRPTVLPAPKALVRLALGEMADELLIASQRAEPAVLDTMGFKFTYTFLEDALRNELGSPEKSTT